MRRLSPWLVLVAMIALVGGSAAAQQTAPRYVSSEPAAGEFAHRAPEAVSITFSDPLGAESTMAVTDECGRKVDAADVSIDENEMTVSLIAGPSGTYTVTYSATGADVNSSTTPGSFTFRAHLGAACDGSTDNDHGGHGGHDGGEGGMRNDHQGHAEGRPDDHGAHDRGMQTHPTSHSMGVHEGTDHPTDEHSHSPQRRRPGHPHPGRDTEPPVQEEAEAPSGGGPGAAAPSSASAESQEATGTDLVIALGLAMGFGALGGVLLRFNPLD